jgi:eukaryotic-like serine/threonine-protein kinase
MPDAANGSMRPSARETARAPDLDRLLPPGGALGGRLFTRLLNRRDVSGVLLPPGTQVGCWRLGEPLGQGGSSVVYLADRADGHFEQQAAVKLVHGQRNLVRQFRRERQILARLGHPGIVRVMDGGELEGGQPWFAMEAVRGERIDRYVQRHRLGLVERLALFEQVCEAVAYVHGQRLIHCDIKPGNLLVDEAGRPRLLDFGIAMIDGAFDEDVYVGMTPIYASPEQLAGGPVTVASDIYQLGSLLRALVMPNGHPCGTLPRALHAGVVSELGDLIARATAYDASRRYPSVPALAADIAFLELAACGE